MSFNSLGFFVFFPIVATAYFLLPYRWRAQFLLLASCVFYMAYIPIYILVLFVLICIDFSTALLIERSHGTRRKHWLMVSIVSLVAVLFVFKYFNFFNANISVLAQLLHWRYPIGILQLALPLGISFHTFQSLSYVLEVYRGKYKAERNFLTYALYVMFFPQLVAGPIERPQQLLPQLHQAHDFDYAPVVQGLRQMLWGFFKKIVIADRLAAVVDTVYAYPSHYSGLSLLVATLFFAFQLYCDFSGYTDIALGAAKVLGINLVQNFDRPFASQSIAELWRRWHISLSSWFRDYFYTPLALSLARKHSSRLSIYLALFVTFIVIGFWHGANWTFGIFGALQGLYIVGGELTKKFRAQIAHLLHLQQWPHVQRAWRIFVTFCLFDMSLIFFRAQHVSDAWYIVTHLLSGIEPSAAYIKMGLSGLGLSASALFLSVLLVVGMEFAQFWGKEETLFARFARQPWYMRWGIYYALLYMIVAFGSSTHSAFIYFNF